MTTQLRKYVIAGLLMSTVSIGLVSFITTGLSVYEIEDEVQTNELEELGGLAANSTSDAQTAEQRAGEIEAETEFFSLPGVINTLRTVFDSINVWEAFIGHFIHMLDLNHAEQNWIQTLAVGTIMITVAFVFAKRIR